MSFLRAFLVLGVFAACLPAADLSLLNLAPADTRVAAGINIEQAKASRLGQHILSRMETQDPEFQKFIAATGFDPRRDVREILILSPGGKTNRKLVLARGDYNREKLDEAAKLHGARQAPYNGINLWSDPKNPNNDAFAIVDNSLAIAGDIDSLRQAIDRRNAGRRASFDPTFASEIGKVSGLYDAWFVSTVPMAEFAGQVPDQRMNGALQGDAFKGIRQASGGLTLREDPVRFNADFVSATAQDASSLAGAIQFLGGLMRMGQQQPSGAVNAITASLSVTANNNLVNVTFTIPASMLENAPKRPQRRVAPVVHRSR